MCILCVIQKWSRTVATMLPWLVIPLIGFWALSQLLPPAFRFEITSPRLACVFVLLVTLFWYEILMPQLSVWSAKNNARLREKKRLEAIELQKLRKSATRRCRNCLTPYKDQNPGGGKFMCSYCGHISKRPVLDLPVPPGMGLSNYGILKDLMGRSGKILNPRVWSDNGWMCGQDWLENGSWASGSFSEKSSNWSGDGILGGDDHCSAEKSFSRVLIFFCKACKGFFLSIIWVLRKLFRISSSRDNVSIDAERRGLLDKHGENAGNCQESRSEKARRKAEERRQARIEKELLEEEERKQREEVARLVEERRKLRDEKMEAEKRHGKGSPSAKEKDRKKEAESKRQERKKDKDKDKDRASNKSNSDAEELDKRAGKDNVRHRKSGSEIVKGHGTSVGHVHKVSADTNHYRGNVGTRYLDRMKGTIFSSSRAFTGGGFFGRGTNVNSASAYRRETSQLDRATGKPYMNGHQNNNAVSHSVVINPQPSTAPRKTWQQLFTRSSSVVSPASPNVIARPHGNSHSEVPSSQFSTAPLSNQAFNNPINFGLPSPFSLPSFSFGSRSSSTGMSLSSEAMFPRIGEKPSQFLPEESEIFEDPCYVPDPVSLIGPVSESLDNFQLDLGVEGEKPSTLKNRHVLPEVNRPSPIESPMSRVRVPEERHPTSFLFPSTHKAQDGNHMPVDELSNANEKGTWQMWTSSPLGPDSSGLFGGSARWFLPQELNGTKKEEPIQPVAPKTMASLFKKDEGAISEPRSPRNNFTGNGQNGEIYNSGTDGPWPPNNYFDVTSGNENQFDMSTPSWVKKEKVSDSGDGVGKPSTMRPSLTGLYSTADVPSLWAYD